MSEYPRQPLSAPPAPAPRRTASVLWGVLLLVPLLVELVAVLNRTVGDTLTESSRALMGSPAFLRWWLVECGLAALGGWLVLHFADPIDWGWRQLAALLLAAVVAAVGLWMVQ